MPIESQLLSFTYRVTAPRQPTSQMSALLGAKAPFCPISLRNKEFL